MVDESYVVKICTALSNKPFFVKITEPTMSIDSIFSEAINTLKTQGKPLESQQLEQLYKAHQIFNNGKVIQKGDLFSDLGKKEQTIANQNVIVAELDLVSSHSGGIKNDLSETMDEFHTQYFKNHIQGELDWFNKNSVGKYIVMFSSNKIIEVTHDGRHISAQYQNLKQVYAAMLLVHFLRINSTRIDGTTKRVMQLDLDMAMKFNRFIDDYIDPVDKEFLGQDGIKYLTEFVEHTLLQISQQYTPEKQLINHLFVQKHGMNF